MRHFQKLVLISYFAVPSQNGFQSDMAVPLNNDAFLAMMSRGSGGLTVDINVMTRYHLDNDIHRLCFIHMYMSHYYIVHSPQVYTVVFVSRDILNLVAAEFSVLMAVLVLIFLNI